VVRGGTIEPEPPSAATHFRSGGAVLSEDGGTESDRRLESGTRWGRGGGARLCLGGRLTGVGSIVHSGEGKAGASLCGWSESERGAVVWAYAREAEAAGGSRAA